PLPGHHGHLPGRRRALLVHRRAQALRSRGAACPIRAGGASSAGGLGASPIPIRPAGAPAISRVISTLSLTTTPPVSSTAFQEGPCKEEHCCNQGGRGGLAVQGVAFRAAICYSRPPQRSQAEAVTMDIIKLNATPRSESGKGPSRRLRRNAQIPAVA